MPGFGGGYNEKPKTVGQKVAAVIVATFLIVFIGYVIIKNL
jgi:flagellar motor component MotA